jgi:hypothetical protein
VAYPSGRDERCADDDARVDDERLDGVGLATFDLRAGVVDAWEVTVGVGVGVGSAVVAGAVDAGTTGAELAA